MRTLVCSALLCGLPITGIAAQLSVSPQYISAEYASPKIIRVHHEATDDVPTTQMLTALPADDWPMTNWYKQTVYDFGGNKIGEIADLLVDHDGKNTAVLIGVGGVLGIGEKYVAVPFDAVHFKKKDDGWYPVINTTKEALKSAPGYRYDRKAQMWGRENAPASVGGPGIPPANQR
jgi:sporulation protein YlmC with PRC-barrel domain